MLAFDIQILMRTSTGYTCLASAPFSGLGFDWLRARGSSPFRARDVQQKSKSWIDSGLEVPFNLGSARGSMGSWGSTTLYGSKINSTRFHMALLSLRLGSVCGGRNSGDRSWLIPTQEPDSACREALLGTARVPFWLVARLGAGDTVWLFPGTRQYCQQLGSRIGSAFGSCLNWSGSKLGSPLGSGLGSTGLGSGSDLGLC